VEEIELSAESLEETGIAEAVDNIEVIELSEEVPLLAGEEDEESSEPVLTPDSPTGVFMKDIERELSELPSVPVVETRAQASAPRPPAPAPSPAPVFVEEEITDPDFDAEVASIFSEEASELLESADASLAAWMRDRQNAALIFELKRALHTLKGGARM